MERVRSSWQAIASSPEVRRLAKEALSFAEVAVQRSSARTLSSVGGGIARAVTERVAGGQQTESRAA